MVKGYEKEFQEAISILSSKGIVVDFNALDYTQSVIYQFDFDSGRFNEKSQNDLMDLFNKIYLNSYGKAYGLYQVIRALNKVTKSQLKNYNSYLDMKANAIDLNRLSKFTDDLIKRNNARKKELKSNGLYSKASEIQYLINNDVFFDNGSFYRYNGKRFLFVKDLMKMFSKVKDENPHLSTSIMNMHTPLFARHLTNANGIISDWFDYDLRQRRLSEASQDYYAISQLTKSFE